MLTVLVCAAFIVMLAAFFAYNPVRRKWAGIIGVGGAYISVIGILGLASIIVQIVKAIGGQGFGSDSSTGEIIMFLVVAVVCLGYMVYVMVARCQTAGQRVMLPFAIIIITFGFCWRLLAAIVLHVPMENGKQAESSFPAVIFDTQENLFRLQSDSGDHADYYCEKTGQTVQFYKSDIADGLPNGWRRGS